MTAPTSVCSCVAGPTMSSSICPASSSSTRGAISSCSSRMRSAEQRCPALLNADMNAVLGATLVVGLVYLVLNLLADVLYRLLDPRVA